jgi:hypothetical protein
MMALTLKAVLFTSLAIAATFACGGGNGDGDEGSANAGDGDSANNNGDGDRVQLGGASGTGDGDSGNGGDGDSSGSGDGDGIGKACASSDQDARLTQANLLFVVDRSGSMNCNAPQYTSDACDQPEKQRPGKPSKWEETQAAISGALDSLVGAENVNVGLTVFPKPDPVEQCLVSTAPDVEIKRLTNNHKNDIDDFLGAVAPQGETPIAGASLTSYNYLSDALVNGDLEGNTFVVLFTDGEETCDVDDMGAPTEVSTNFVDEKVSDATLFNIRTFVIGAPGSEGARSPLSEIAFQGLTAASDDCSHGANNVTRGDCHFDMTESTDFVGDLSSALSEITNDKALSCVYDVPSQGSVDLSKVNVSYTPDGGEPVDILRDDSADCDDGANGWQYSADFTKINLCGDACDDVKERDGGLVSIVLGCPTLVVR